MNSIDKLRFSDEYPYYVYIHYRNDNGTPFYVGRGKKYEGRLDTPGEYQRAYEKGINDRSDFWHRIVNKAGYTVEIFLDELTYEEAYHKEIELVKLYGRRNIGKGPLVNLTDGGEGNEGYVTSEETKKKLRDFNLIPVEKTIEMYSFPEPNTGCFLWAGPVYRNKAFINVDGGSYSAAHFLYQYFNGVKLGPKEQIHRSCNNRLCVNPDHFIRGKSKGVTAHRSTFRQHLQVIDEHIVREIRKLKDDGKTPKEIMSLLNLTHGVVGGVIYNKTWRWVV